MPTDLRNLPAYLNDDATYRTWGLGIAAQLAAVGLVKTTDTGQINWATVTRPAASVVAGYEMWRFNDTLQATKPVFIKLEYSLALTGTPKIWVTVSTATNGAGTPTGQVGSQSTATADTEKSAGVTLPSYCSGSTSRLNLCTNHDATSNAFSILVAVERTKTAAGVETADGIVTLFHSPSSQGRYQVIPNSGAIPSQQAGNMAASLASGITSVAPNVALSPTVAPLGKVNFAFWAVYMHADLAELVPVQADHLGATRTMMPLGDGIDSTNIVRGTATGHSLAILWE